MTVTQRKPTEIRRREIASAALTVIGEYGATSLTTARLAEEVGMTAGALFRHYSSVDEMLCAAVDLAIEQIEIAFPATDLPPIDRLRALALRRIDLIGGTPGLAWLLLSDQVYLCVPDTAVARLRGLVARSRRYLLKALRDGVATGELRNDLSPELMLPIFTGTVHSLILGQGVHKRSGRGRNAVSSERVVDALIVLLTQPSSTRSHMEKTR